MKNRWSQQESSWRWAWYGQAAPRFTGKQLEGRIADMVQQANAQLRSSAPESGLELSYQDYQRGLFSSHLQLVVKPIAGQANGWLAAGQSVVLDEVVDHGPFPLASLKPLIWRRQWLPSTPRW